MQAQPILMKPSSSGTTATSGRDHQRGEESEEERVAAGKAHPRERIAGHRAEQHAQRGRDVACITLLKPQRSDRVFEHLDVVVEGDLARQPLDVAVITSAGCLSEVDTIQTKGAPSTRSAMPSSQIGRSRQASRAPGHRASQRAISAAP